METTEDDVMDTTRHLEVPGLVFGVWVFSKLPNMRLTEVVGVNFDLGQWSAKSSVGINASYHNPNVPLARSRAYMPARWIYLLQNDGVSRWGFRLGFGRGVVRD